MAYEKSMEQICLRFKNEKTISKKCSFDPMNLGEGFQNKEVREKSKNWIAPTKYDCMKFAAEAWKAITKKTILNGARKCYIIDI